MVAEELMVTPENVQSLAAAARVVGRPLSPADLIAAGSRASEREVSLTAARPDHPDLPEAVPPKLRWDRLLPWRGTGGDRTFE